MWSPWNLVVGWACFVVMIHMCGAWGWSFINLHKILWCSQVTSYQRATLVQSSQRPYQPPTETTLPRLRKPVTHAPTVHKSHNNHTQPTTRPRGLHVVLYRAQIDLDLVPRHPIWTMKMATIAGWRQSAKWPICDIFTRSR